MTALAISAGLADARRLATIAHLDLGAGVASIRVYDGTRPEAGGAATTLLVEIPLAKPCGVLAAGVITLVPGDLAMCLNGGGATWARIVNGDGEWCVDCDVSDMGSSAPIRLSNTTLLAGAAVALVSGVLR